MSMSQHISLEANKLFTYYATCARIDASRVFRVIFCRFDFWGYDT